MAVGHLPTLAQAIVEYKALADHVLQLLLDKMEAECACISQRSPPFSPFHKISTDQYASFQWEDFIEDISHKAPTPFHVLSSIVAHRNKKKMNTAHYPGLCNPLIGA